MEGNRASGFNCPSCGYPEAFIHDYDSDGSHVVGLALTCVKCEHTWWEPLAAN